MRSTISNMPIERALVSHCVIVRHFIRILTMIDPTHETSTISYAETFVYEGCSSLAAERLRRGPSTGTEHRVWNT